MKGEDEDGSKDTKSKKKKDKKKVSILWLNLKPNFKKHQTVVLRDAFFFIGETKSKNIKVVDDF